MNRQRASHQHFPSIARLWQRQLRRTLIVISLVGSLRGTNSAATPPARNDVQQRGESDHGSQDQLLLPARCDHAAARHLFARLGPASAPRTVDGEQIILDRFLAAQMFPIRWKSRHLVIRGTARHKLTAYYDYSSSGTRRLSCLNSIPALLIADLEEDQRGAIDFDRLLGSLKETKRYRYQTAGGEVFNVRIQVRGTGAQLALLSQSTHADIGLENRSMLVLVSRKLLPLLERMVRPLP